MAIMLVELFCFCFFAIYAVAEATDDGFVYSNYGSYVAITGYTGAERNVVIPETIEGCVVTNIATSAFENNIDIVSVTMPDSVEKIGYNAFSGCSNLNSITLSPNIISIQ